MNPYPHLIHYNLKCYITERNLKITLTRKESSFKNSAGQKTHVMYSAYLNKVLKRLKVILCYPLVIENGEAMQIFFRGITNTSK